MTRSRQRHLPQQSPSQAVIRLLTRPGSRCSRSGPSAGPLSKARSTAGGARPERAVGAALRYLAGDRAHHQRAGDGDHRRHPPGAGQPEDDPGVTHAAGQGDRPGRHRHAGLMATGLGLPVRPSGAQAGPAPADGPLIDGLRGSPPRSAGVADRPLQPCAASTACPPRAWTGCPASSC